MKEMPAVANSNFLVLGYLNQANAALVAVFCFFGDFALILQTFFGLI